MISTDSTENLPAWTKRFLRLIAETGNVSAACKACRIDRSNPYHLRARSPEFKAAWETADEQACDELEAEARRRALESSDGLLQFMLKALRPDKYREVRDVNLSGSVEVIKRVGADLERI